MSKLHKARAGVTEPYKFEYTCNFAGELVTEKYPSGRVGTNTFDSNGRVDSVSSRGAGHAPRLHANGFHYNEKGLLDRLRLGNGLWEGMTINSRYQPTQITLGTSSGASELLKLDYNYGSTDNKGIVKSGIVTVPTIGPELPAPGDFDGDGKADVSIFRPSDAAWYRLNSSNGGFFAQQFGANGDRPTPAAFRY